MSRLDQTIHALITLIDKQPDQAASQVNEEAIFVINKAAATLENRKLKGHLAKTEADVLALAPEEIDLAHAIFLSQQDISTSTLQAKRNYEAAIDLMALQIRARLPKAATPEQKIRTINDFIFHELGFRFPPHTLYVKEIDRYTFLSSVIDSRRGICLGVSVLYLAIAQRLGLPLEIVTPPGHIYVRYRSKDKIINIETTARGIDVESSEYLSIDTFALQERNLKETVGLVHFNRAADDLRTGAFDKALKSYEKAKLYMGNDCLLDELMGTCSILNGNEEQGKKLLKKILEHSSPHTIGKSSTAEDYLNGKTDSEGLKTLFLHTDEDHKSILAKQKLLQEAISRKTDFRAGICALAMTWIQLHRLGEALELFEKYHALDPSDPKVEYYLAVIYSERYNYPKAWEHFKNAESITAAHGHYPKALKEFKNSLSQQCPE
jgi:tetratricopeptide (TPR) repeat protein